MIWLLAWIVGCAVLALAFEFLFRDEARKPEPSRGKVDNEVTRAGEALRPFVEAMKDVDERGRELYEKCKTLEPGEILMKLNVDGRGHDAAVREIEAYALMITDEGKDKMVRAIGRCYHPTKTHWEEES